MHSAANADPRLKYAELLLRKGMQEEANAQLQDLVRDDPACARGHYLLAVVRSSEGAPREAVPHFQEAIRLAPDDFRAINGLGVALQQLGMTGESLACYRESARINPHYQDARINLALLLKDQGRLCESERELCKALELDPQSVRISYNLANVLHLQGRSVEAVAAYREVLRLDPEHLDAQQNLLFALHYSPLFSDRDVFNEHLSLAATGGTSRPGKISPVTMPRDRRIRIGYVSADFRDHAVARFIEPVLAHHDRNRFEIFCYANVARADLTTQLLQGLSDHWRDIYGMADEKAAFLIESDGIDILIDLAGQTSGNRLRLFALKPAPVQITWIGYPDTTGLPQMDYRVTDGLADPPGREDFHVERLIRLPRIFSCYLAPPQSPEVGPLPCDSSGAVTFGSFNNLAKVTPEVVSVWARVLLSVPGSRLLMKCKPLADPEVRARVTNAFVASGVDPGRIELREGEPTTYDHLAQYHHVDIALDTFPYNGTTTTCEALWMGVPVVTLAGTRHAARTGASILTNCGLSALVAEDADGFVAIAHELARERATLREIRRVLRDRVRGSAVMDGPGVTRELEDALLGVLKLAS